MKISLEKERDGEEVKISGIETNLPFGVLNVTSSVSVENEYLNTAISHLMEETDSKEFLQKTHMSRRSWLVSKLHKISCELFSGNGRSREFTLIEESIKSFQDGYRKKRIRIEF